MNQMLLGKNEENALLEFASDEPVPPSDIVSFNELRSCADLYRLYSTGKLEIQPDFQREVVWKNKDQTRFIDSLVKQLPIPSMCFSLDYKTQKWKVIDGLQRMSSIINFISSDTFKLSDIHDIHPLLKGKRSKAIRESDGDEFALYSMVQDVSIPITVLRCDYSQPSHMQYLFTIFHRLNSGGVRLNNQEIRNCIYTGSFNSMLKDFDKNNAAWNSIKKNIWGSSSRFKSIELLLRVVALRYELGRYDGNLARFLNNYMHEHMDASDDKVEEVRSYLERISSLTAQVLGSGKAKVTVTVLESVLVGVFNNIDLLELLDTSAIKERISNLVTNEKFNDAAVYSIASESNVKTRINLALQIFGA